MPANVPPESEAIYHGTPSYGACQHCENRRNDDVYGAAAARRKVSAEGIHDIVSDPDFMGTEKRVHCRSWEGWNGTTDVYERIRAKSGQVVADGAYLIVIDTMHNPLY